MIQELIRETELMAVILIPLVSGLVEIFKNAFIIDARFLPLLSLVTGIVVNVLVALGFNLPIATAILTGAIVGLGASGLYDTLTTGSGEYRG